MNRPFHRALALLLAGPLALAACQGPAMGWPGGPVETADRLADYKAAHYRALGEEPAAEVGFTELVTDIGGRRLVYLGDHHLDVALHDQHLLILRALHSRGVQLTLALECYGTEDQATVDAFLARRIDLTTLRDTLRQRWPQSWLDALAVDARYYRELLAFARDARIPVTAIEPTPRLPLELRDAAIADSVRDALAAWPDHTVVTIVGHAHILGPGHVYDRVDVPALVVAARPSDELAHKLAFRPPTTPFVRTENDIVVPTRWSP